MASLLHGLNLHSASAERRALDAELEAYITDLKHNLSMAASLIGSWCAPALFSFICTRLGFTFHRLALDPSG